MRTTMSAEAVPAVERFDWFADLVSTTLSPAELHCERPAEFEAGVSMLDLGEGQVSSFHYSPLRSRRTPALIRRCDPEQYQLGLVTGHPMWISQHRNDSGALSGDLVLWDTSRPYRAGAPQAPAGSGAVQVVVLQLPRAALPLRSDRLDRLLARRIPGGTGMAAVLAQYLASLSEHAGDCTAQERERLGRVAVDLAAACLAQQLDAYAELPVATREQVLRERVHAFIEHNLGDPGLTPQVIADRHHLSVRGLHLLFRGEPRSVAATVRARRLERCHADLGRPDLLDRPIHAVAARWGFTSPAVFSRAFREAYGLSPTELRERTRQQPCPDRQRPLRLVQSPPDRPALGSVPFRPRPEHG
ncbi:helix-turn-helix domain-containing protein [Kitasatospora sp. NPDC058965]|uniref:AraC-like ligand-binding domain-containing protein n=1 Tax=Kitasatospora sp. NPDC058965 TaxID=3346682 RepID=UPI00367E9F82